MKRHIMENVPLFIPLAATVILIVWSALTNYGAH